MSEEGSGLGSFRKRANGSWEARINVNGKQKSFSAKTKALARAKMEQYVKANQGLKGDSNLTFGELFNYWLCNKKQPKVKSSTFDVYEQIYKSHIASHSIANVTLRNLTPELLEDFFLDQTTVMVKRSATRLSILVHEVLKYATKNKYIRFNPMDNVEMPSEDEYTKKEKEISVYTDQEICTLLNAIYEKQDSTKRYKPDAPTQKERLFRFAALFDLMLNTGMRLGETLALTWDDINFETKIVSVDKTKATIITRGGESDKRLEHTVTKPKTKNSVREIPLNVGAIKALKELKERQKEFAIETNLVVCALDGGYMYSTVINRTFKQICELLDIEYRGVHALRHTFASKQLELGTPIAVISKILGHSNVSITQNIYIHITEKMKLSAINLVSSEQYTKER